MIESMIQPHREHKQSIWELARMIQNSEARIKYYQGRVDYAKNQLIRRRQDVEVLVSQLQSILDLTAKFPTKKP